MSCVENDEVQVDRKNSWRDDREGRSGLTISLASDGTKWKQIETRNDAHYTGMSINERWFYGKLFTTAESRRGNAQSGFISRPRATSLVASGVYFHNSALINVRPYTETRGVRRVSEL